MKNNIIYPLLTAGLGALIAFVLSLLGFDFKSIISTGLLKEVIFIVCFAIILTGIVVYDVLKNKLQSKNKELESTKQSLKATKEQLDNLLENYEEFKHYNALKNFKEDNNSN